MCFRTCSSIEAKREFLRSFKSPFGGGVEWGGDGAMFTGLLKHFYSAVGSVEQKCLQLYDFSLGSWGTDFMCSTLPISLSWKHTEFSVCFLRL